jgi:hypothetical protein
MDFFCSELFRNLLVLAGVIVAIVSVVTARTLARKKQTADMLFASRSDETLQLGLRHIREYSTGSSNIRALVDVESDEVASIKYVLNHFETLSVGIQSGIYDEGMIKKSWCNMICDAHKWATPLIDEIRTKRARPTVLQELDWLAKRWNDSTLERRKP